MFRNDMFFVFSISILIFCIYTNLNLEPIQLNNNIFKIPKNDAELEVNKFPFIEESKIIKKIKEKTNINKHEQIKIGIDFGSIYTRYGYIFQNDITKIYSSDKRSPSDLILSKRSKKGKGYSIISQTSMINYGKRELNNIIYIKGIKSIFYSLNNTLNNNILYIFPQNIIDKLDIKI